MQYSSVGHSLIQHLSPPEKRVFSWLLTNYYKEIIEQFDTQSNYTVITLLVDPILLIEFDAELAKWMFFNFSKCVELCKRMIFHFASSFRHNLPVPDSLILNLKMKHAYYSQEFFYPSIRNLLQSGRKATSKLIQVPGIVVELFPISDKLNRVCEIFKCMCSYEASLSLKNNVCSCCKQVKQHLPPYTVSVRCRKIVISDPNQNNFLASRIQVILPEYLSSNVELGDKIQVVGELFYKYSKTKKEYVAVSHIMKANNLINITKKKIQIPLDNSSQMQCEISFNSKISIANRLIINLGDVFNEFPILSRLLLMTIASAFTVLQTGLRVLFLTNGDTHLNSLVLSLLSAGNLVLYSKGSQFHGSTFQKKGDEEAIQYAGCTVRAKDGILYIPGLELLSNSKLKEVANFLEDSVASLSQQVQIPVCCGVVASYFSNKQPQQFFLQYEKTSFARGFDIMIPLEFTKKDNWYYPKTDIEFLNYEQLKNDLSCISSKMPKFSEESRNLLKGFWNLQRRLSDLITIKNYKSLINLAFSHAKICQSDYVDIVDACFAIYYMEEYTSTFLQFSVLEFSGKHCNNLSSYGDCLNTQIKGIHEHIQNKLLTYGVTCEKKENWD